METKKNIIKLKNGIKKKKYDQTEYWNNVNYHQTESWNLKVY